MIALAAMSGIADPLPQASRFASRFDATFYGLLVASALVVLLLAALNLVFLIRYRSGSPAPRGPLPIATWKIEAGWIGLTTVAFLGIFGWGVGPYLDLARPPRDAYAIDIVARQWMWDVRQPNGRREFGTLHVPIGRPILLRLTSEDVIHSLFIPAFRIKQDVVPGKTTRMWFEATQPGTYTLRCTQFCGTKHAAMLADVVAQTPGDYAAWLAEGNAAPALADRGRQLFVRYGCSGCHAPTAAVHAPPLEGLYGKLVPLDGGSFVSVDDAYVRDSILEPTKQIAAGYAPLMPSFKGIIPEGDLLELIAYVKSLAHETPAPLPPPARP